MKQQPRHPLVSVIMPVYNVEKYVAEAIDSVLDQTYSHIELICFNDASTDDSLQVLEDIAKSDSRLKIIDSRVNVKQGGGRNRALRVAEGEFVMFLDADDALDHRAVELCVRAAVENDSEAVFFDWSLYYPTQNRLIRVEQLGADAVSLKDDDLRRRIIERSTSIWSAMYRKSLITDNNLYFPEGVFYEDNAVALAIHLLARNPVKLDVALYLYRQDNASVTRSKNDMRFFDRINSATILLSNLKRLGLYERFADALDYVFIRQYLEHTVYGAIYRFDSPQSEKIAEVKSGIKRYVPDFRHNLFYRQRSVSKKLKLELHMRFPRLIKSLSNLRHRLK